MMDITFYPRRPTADETPENDPYLCFMASLTEEERTIVDRDALGLCQHLIREIVTYSQRYPQVPSMIWLHAIHTLLIAFEGMMATGHLP